MTVDLRRDEPIYDTDPIYVEGEFCCVCLSVEDLGQWGSPMPEPIMFLTVCTPCYEDPLKFRNWLANEFEEALEADPTMVKNPDGTWSEVRNSLPNA